MMIIKVQITVVSDDGEAEVVEEVAQLQRDELRPADLGLSLKEAKALLSGIQQTMVEQQVAAFVAVFAILARLAGGARRLAQALAGEVVQVVRQREGHLAE